MDWASSTLFQGRAGPGLKRQHAGLPEGAGHGVGAALEVGLPGIVPMVAGVEVGQKRSTLQQLHFVVFACIMLARHANSA